MQSMGLEWVYRIYQEPRRMWWRYAKTNTLFAAILIQNAFGLRKLSRFS
jgi:N-acetylglucosaminyldiphosphoundecaprenol N-acetyl-beta-D-mannosaminyltransferase